LTVLPVRRVPINRVPAKLVVTCVELESTHPPVVALFARFVISEQFPVLWVVLVAHLASPVLILASSPAHRAQTAVLELTLMVLVPILVMIVRPVLLVS